MSEELENSLQQAIESYLGDRLRAIDDQLSRLHADFNEALAHLRESSTGESLAATPLAESIAAHLKTAREQKLTEGAIPASQPSGEVAEVKRGVAEIEKQQTQSGVLGALLTSAAPFAERVAIFVIRHEQALGWRECEASDPTNLESIRGISFPLSADTLVGHAASSALPWCGAPGSNSEDELLIGQLGGDPQSVAAVPLAVRGKVVAVLYADTNSNDPSAVNLDALELLSRVAGMAVDLVSGARSAAETHVSESPAPPVVAEPEAAQETIEAQASYEAEPTYQPSIEPQASETVAESDVEAPVSHEVEVVAGPSIEAAAESEFDVVREVEATSAEVEAAPMIEAEVSAEPIAEAVVEPEVQVVHEVEAAPPEDEAAPATEVDVSAEPATEFVAEEVHEATGEPEAVSQPAMVEPQPPPPQPTFAPMAPGSAAQYATPLGSSRRRSGIPEPDLPIEVGEEERRLHNDARRFARLLVSEIKLYNEKKVTEGRSSGDIYDRLRDDIERSREMYLKRVAPPVAARHDYFHQELVNTLAEGDSAKLGSGYPGASVAMN